MEPTDPELKRALKLFRSAAGQQEAERNKTAQEIWKIIVEQQYSIGTVGQSPALQGVRFWLRTTRRTVARETASVRTISLIGRRCSK